MRLSKSLGYPSEMGFQAEWVFDLSVMSCSEVLSYF